ncbi:MAG: antibiotic biosynthesis monooxygenase [Bacteroidota bacterium]|nr:antibiotic biosynthesis monooxygenase [Bacteroidota bacterium]
MLVRIVLMTFKPDNIGDFLALFHQTKDQIRNFEGCLHLELLKDYYKDNVYCTYSHWIDNKALENYRNSNLFREVWRKTKIHFSERPGTISLYKEG